MVALGLAGCAVPIEHRRAEGALGPYSGSVRVGDLVFVSGKVGEAGGSFEDEAAGALDAVEDELARAGLGLEDLVSVTVYLTDIGRYDVFNGIYRTRLPEPHPARACVGVAALPGGRRVEVAGIAARG